MLIVSLSGRALAQSGRRAGWHPIVLDGFADADTRQASSYCVRLGLRKGGFERRELGVAIQALGFGKERPPVVYGAGLESHPTLLRHLTDKCILYGNAPQVVDLVIDPRRFFALLDALAIAHPQVRFTPPGDEQGWLMKRSGASGGGHVRPWSAGLRWGGGHYFQRRVPGTAMSVLFISTGTAFRIIGFNTLWADAREDGSPYRYAGAVNRVALNRGQITCVTRYVSRLSEGLTLRGLNSLDFVLARGEPAVLELNPRPSATFELYEGEIPEGWLYWHMQACKGRLPRRRRFPSSPVRAHAVVYAPQTLKVVSYRRWPSWSADRPVPGSHVGVGEPLCTVTAEGTDQRVVETLLHKRKWSLLETLYRPRQAA